MEIKETRNYNCPRCRVTDYGTVMDYLADIEKKAGNLPLDRKVCSRMETLCLTANPKLGDKVTLANMHHDFCLFCGQEYIKKIEFVETMMELTKNIPEKSPLIIPNFRTK